MSRITLSCYFRHLLSVVQEFQPNFVRWVLPTSSLRKNTYTRCIFQVQTVICDYGDDHFFQWETLDFCVESRLQHLTAACAEMVSPQPLSEASNTVRWHQWFLPIDGQLQHKQLWIKEGTACLSRQLLPLQQMAFSSWSRVWPTAHWIISFPHMAWISPRAERALNCNCLPHTGCSVLIIHKRCTQHLTWNLNRDSKNQQKIFQISSYVIG